MISHSIAQDIPATDVSTALNSFRNQAVTKIDQDLGITARAFADAKNIQTSARWSDWFSPFLDISREVYDGLTAIPDVRLGSIRSAIKTGLELADSSDKIYSWAHGLDRFRQDGQNLALAIDGPAYNSAVKDMLNRAEDASFPLHLIFDYGSYHSSILNDLNGISGANPMRIIRRPATVDRAGGQVLPSAYAAKN